MNGPATEAPCTSASFLRKGRFLLPLIALIACQQASDTGRINTSLKGPTTRCYETESICVTTKWKATGLVHGNDSELAEILISMKVQNTCNPARSWFTAKDPEMEKEPKRRPDEIFFSLRLEMWKKELEVYRKRAELDCSRVLVTFHEVILEDEHGFELYRTKLSDVDAGANPPGVKSGNNTVQAKLSIPRVYLDQIRHVIHLASFKRIWVHGVKRSDKKF